MPKQKVNRKPGIHLHKTKARRVLTATTPNYYSAEFYWILIAKNGKTIARSSETYKTRRSAVTSILVAASIFLDGRPYELIPYYDHSKDGTPLKHC
jgi:hypothetical protein